MELTTATPEGTPKVEDVPAATPEVRLEKSQEPPVHEVVGGSSVRQYLNKHLTKDVLDGLKEVGRLKPANPLVFLGEFLIQRGNAVEAAQTENGGGYVKTEGQGITIEAPKEAGEAQSSGVSAQQTTEVEMAD